MKKHFCSRSSKIGVCLTSSFFYFKGSNSNLRFQKRNFLLTQNTLYTCYSIISYYKSFEST